MTVVGEAADWATMIAEAPATQPDMVMVDWGLVDAGYGADLTEMRLACPAAVMIVLVSSLSARDQAAISAGADAFISKGDTADRVAERLRALVAEIPSG